RLPYVVFGVAERLRCARHLPSERQPVPRRKSGVGAGDGNAAAMSRAGIPLPRVAISLPIVCVLTALALAVGCQRAQVEGAAADKTPSIPRLERQSDGTDALRFSASQRKLRARPEGQRLWHARREPPDNCEPEGSRGAQARAAGVFAR